MLCRFPCIQCSSRDPGNNQRRRVARNELVIERCRLERIAFEPSAIFNEQVISGITEKLERLKSAILSGRIVRGEYQERGPDTGRPKGIEHLEVVGKLQNLRCLVAREIHDKGWRFRQVFEQLFEFIFGRSSVQKMHFVPIR